MRMGAEKRERQRASMREGSAFITGVSGFVGTHLAEALAARQWIVYGYDLRDPATHLDGFYEGDLSDEAELCQVLREVQPQVVFHLAGILKAEQTESLYSSYVQGTIALFEAIYAANAKPRVIVAGSSAIYGMGASARPITENSASRPLTHYAVSKAAQELVAIRYSLAHGVPVVRVRNFNLLGPGLSPQMACSSFARQIALAERTGGKGELHVGDLAGQRDFVDVRDAVRAYGLIAEMESPGSVYNICSERAVSIRRCLGLLTGMSTASLKVVVDSQSMQEHDVSIQIGSAKRLKHDTGWRPKISLKRSLQDLLDYWRQDASLEKESR